MKKYYLVTFIILLGILSGCTNSPNSQSSQSSSIDGKYTVSDGGMTCYVSVSGNNWRGDCTNEYGQSSGISTGIVKGTDLYGEHGAIKVG